MRRARIRHYAGHTNDRRERWMRSDADRVQGNLEWVVGASRRCMTRQVPGSPSVLRSKLHRRAKMVLGRPTI